MNSSGNILKNAISAILLNLISAAVYFFLFKYLLVEVGIEQFGVWSLVGSTISVGAVANVALSESVIRFVALYSVKNDWVTVSKVLITSCYILSVLLLVVLLLIYGGAYYILPFVIKPKYLVLARSLLPCGLFGFWLNGVASAFLSYFEGLRLAYIKNIVFAISVILFYAACMFLVPRYGLIGVMYGNVIQYGALLIASSILVFVKMPVFSLKPLSLKSDLFKQIFNYSINLQYVSIITILYEPVTKYILSKYGNLSFVGYYEMGNRLVGQARSLIISATQILVPNLTIEAEKSIAALNVIYYKVFSIVFSISTFMLAAIVLFLPYISILWIHHYEPIFMITTIILGFGWYINTITSPVYFVNYATNSLKINLNGQIIMAVLNPIGCFVLGIQFGSYYVIVGWVIALISGALYTLIASHKKYSINNFELFKPEIKKVIWGLFFVALSWILYIEFHKHCPLYLMIGFTIIIFGALAVVTINMDKNFTYIVNLVKLKFKPV